MESTSTIPSEKNSSPQKPRSVPSMTNLIPESNPLMSSSPGGYKSVSTQDYEVMQEDQENKIKKSNEERKPIDKTSAIAALNAAAALDGCDDQLLPASFRALETELNFHPSLLGKITLVQTMALSLSCPFWGYLADRSSRKRIMSAGMVSWGLTTMLLAFASNLATIMALRAMNGLFLGSIGPISQSILADISPEASRGFQFGLIQMCASGGRIIGGVVTTSASLLHIGGFYGWRWTFLAVGVVSAFLGLIIGLCMDEFSRFPKHAIHRSQSGSIGAGTGEAPNIGRTSIGDMMVMETGQQHPHITEHDQTALQFLKSVLIESFMKPSVIVIILEGIVGTIPWSAMSFLTMYFQYCGLSDTAASIVSASMLFGAMISGPIGGLLGDRVFLWSPYHGRPLLGQLSMIGRVPLLLTAFLVVPTEPTSFSYLATIFFLIGILSIAGVVVNRPLLSDVVRPNHRATTFALAVAIEGAAGALLGAPVVGILAETRFGYVKTDLHMADIPAELRRTNARALGQSLLCLTAIPWMCSFVIYGLVHLTYGTDRDRLRRKLVIELGYDEDAIQDTTLIRSDTAPLVGIY